MGWGAGWNPLSFLWEWAGSRAGELSVFMDGSRQGWWVMELPGAAWPCPIAERDPGARRLSQAQEHTQAWGLEG